jgi:hypothetical protein
MIRWFIVPFLVALIIYGIANRRRSPVVGFPLMFLAAAGIGATINPDALQMVADAIGVGRGVDLAIYIFMLAGVFLIVNIHLRIRAQSETLTRLARDVAIRDAGRGQQ